MQVTLKGQSHEIPASIQLLEIFGPLVGSIVDAQTQEQKNAVSRQALQMMLDSSFQFKLARFLSDSGIPSEVARCNADGSYYLAVEIDEFLGILNNFVAQLPQKMASVEVPAEEVKEVAPVAAPVEGFANTKRRPRTLKAKAS